MPLSGLRAQVWQWARASSSATNSLGNTARVTSSIVDAAGNVYIGGYFTYRTSFGSDDFNTGSGNDEDGFVAKLNANGTWLWATHFEGSSGRQERVSALTFDNSGNLLVAGWFTSGTLYLKRQGTRYATVLTSSSPASNRLPDAFVVVLNPSNAGYISNYSFYGATSSEYFKDVAVAPNGDVIAAGDSDGDIYVVRYPVTGSGTTISATGAGYDFINALAVDGQGNVVVAGGFRGNSITFGSQLPLTNATTTNSASSFVAWLNTSNQWTRARQISTNNTSNETVITGMALNSTGRVTVVGYFSAGQLQFTPNTGLPPINHLGAAGTNDGFIARLNAGGTWTQAARIGGASGSDDATGVAEDASGNAIVVGKYVAPVTFGSTTLTANDTYVARWDGTGNWQGVAQANTLSGAKAVAVRANNDVFVSGDLITDGFFGPQPSPPLAAVPQASNGPSNIYPCFVAYLSTFPLATPDELTASAFTLAPNPAHTQVWVELEAEPAALPLLLLDALGRTVRTQTLPAGATTATLDVAGLPAGLYTVRCGRATRRLVVE